MYATQNLHDHIFVFFDLWLNFELYTIVEYLLMTLSGNYQGMGNSKQENDETKIWKQRKS